MGLHRLLFRADMYLQIEGQHSLLVPIKGRLSENKTAIGQQMVAVGGLEKELRMFQKWTFTLIKETMKKKHQEE